MTEPAYASDSGDTDRLVPVEVDGQRLYVAVRNVHPEIDPDDDFEIAHKQPKLDQVIDGMVVFAGEVARRLENTDAAKVTVEFGCEIAFESGAFVAIIGKASAKSTLRIGLEWNRPTP